MTRAVAPRPPDRNSAWHPHGFCSAIWMGEVAICRPLHDPRSCIVELKALTSSYPDKLREALLREFLWEVLFSIENGERAIARGIKPILPDAHIGH